MIRDGDGKDAEELASSLCRYYEARNREDMDRLPRVTRENVLILKYYSFENYFLDPKIMEKIRICLRGHNLYDIFYGRFRKNETEILKSYIEEAPRDTFKDILDAIDRFVYFENRKK